MYEFEIKFVFCLSNSFPIQQALPRLIFSVLTIPLFSFKKQEFLTKLSQV